VAPPRPATLLAALAGVLVPDNAPELRLVRAWLDGWSGIGPIVVGMTHQGVQVSDEHGAGQWIAVFYSGHGGHHEVTAAGTAQEPTRWRTVQRAAWETLDSRGWR
jgi:hypothetical protein